MRSDTDTQHGHDYATQAGRRLRQRRRLTRAAPVQTAATETDARTDSGAAVRHTDSSSMLHKPAATHTLTAPRSEGDSARDPGPHTLPAASAARGRPAAAHTYKLRCSGHYAII